MRKLKKVTALDNYILDCKFNDGTLSKIDLSPLLKFDAFFPLQDQRTFKKVVNRSIFIEWPDVKLDLSADTVWHMRKETKLTNTKAN